MHAATSLSVVDSFSIVFFFFFYFSFFSISVPLDGLTLLRLFILTPFLAPSLFLLVTTGSYM